jgi:hypothetical protein
MSAIAANNLNSMAALHLPHREVGQWYKGFEEDCKVKAWKSVVSPIVIGSLRPVGYSPSWANNPLSGNQTFTLFKQFNARQPFHNAFTMYALNPSSNYRALWCDTIVLPLKLYNKSKNEIRMKVSHTMIYIQALLTSTHLLFHILNIELRSI